MINKSRNKTWLECKIYDSTMKWMCLYEKEIVKTKVREH